MLIMSIDDGLVFFKHCEFIFGDDCTYAFGKDCKANHLEGVAEWSNKLSDWVCFLNHLASRMREDVHHMTKYRHEFDNGTDGYTNQYEDDRSAFDTFLPKNYRDLAEGNDWKDGNHYGYTRNCTRYDIKLIDDYIKELIINHHSSYYLIKSFYNLKSNDIKQENVKQLSLI